MRKLNHFEAWCLAATAVVVLLWAFMFYHAEAGRGNARLLECPCSGRKRGQ